MKLSPDTDDEDDNDDDDDDDNVLERSMKLEQPSLG